MRIVAAMTFGPGQDLVLLALLVAIAALLVLAPVLRVPYPILLVLGGVRLWSFPARRAWRSPRAVSRWGRGVPVSPGRPRAGPQSGWWSAPCSPASGPGPTPRRSR